MSDSGTSNGEINRLYWDTDESVSDIADRTDVSRRTLYDRIEPRPAGRACPDCDAPLVYRNRTSLENREAECPECGAEAEVEPVEKWAGPELEQVRRAAKATPVRRVPEGGSVLLRSVARSRLGRILADDVVLPFADLLDLLPVLSLAHVLTLLRAARGRVLLAGRVAPVPRLLRLLPTFPVVALHLLPAHVLSLSHVNPSPAYTCKAHSNR